MSTNAFTIDGQLVNIDGNGNRVSALCYGPKHVVIITGMNKLVPSVDAAYKRIRQDACPPNCVRLGLTNPCSKTGICGECMSASSICDLFVTTRMSCYHGRRRIRILIFYPFLKNILRGYVSACQSLMALQCVHSFQPPWQQ